MLHLLFRTIQPPGRWNAPGAHVHIDDHGREFVCHGWECSPVASGPFRRPTLR